MQEDYERQVAERDEAFSQMRHKQDELDSVRADDKVAQATYRMSAKQDGVEVCIDCMCRPKIATAVSQPHRGSTWGCFCAVAGEACLQGSRMKCTPW